VNEALIKRKRKEAEGCECAKKGKVQESERMRERRDARKVEKSRGGREATHKASFAS
jgi:hypothetical protein